MDKLDYEFDMASAPKAREDSKENLGVGFRPFDRIYLLSATLIRGRQIVCLMHRM
jgi:hypothetical protein